MGQMSTFNENSWKPVTLVSPDGRPYTPGDHAEHRQLIASGYRVAPTNVPAGDVKAAVAATAAHNPDVSITSLVEGLAVDARQGTDSAAAATDAAERSKTKTSRRSGGAQ